MLRVSHLSVHYGDLSALEDISFGVEEGKIVALLGANGAGKTSALKAISLLLKPSQGSIQFLGEEITRLSPHRVVELGISHIPEARRLFPHMTVLENLQLGSYAPHARTKRGESLDLVFELFPILAERRSQLAGTLSGGEQQMLAMGRGLMACPKLLLLDEPSLGLAPILVEAVFRITREINSQGVTVLLVEQNVRHALEIADYAYVLETGRITLEGKGQDLLASDKVRKAYLGV